MALSPTGFIDGGRVHGETLRRALYASTNGATGVVRAKDFSVTAYSTPGAGVWVGPGGGVIATRYTDADAGQSYAISNGAAYQLAVPANNTASAVTWQVIVRVKDPQYAGETVPADPANDSYGVIELVSALPSTKPYLHLATITIPANTSTVAAGQITDKRVLANPRSERILKPYSMTFAESNSLTMADEQFPNQGVFPIAVPSWATEVKIIGSWGQLLFGSGDRQPSFWLELGWGRADMIGTQNSFAKALSGSQSRQTVSVADYMAVPSTMRGQNVTLLMKAGLTYGSTGTVEADGWSNFYVDIQFVESPSTEGTWG